MINRRSFLASAAAIPVMAAVSGRASANTVFKQDLSEVSMRQISDIEQLYETPRSHPNDLHMTSEGMWIIDAGRENVYANWASLIDPETGEVIREVQCENTESSSGICQDEDGLWIGSTYNNLVVQCDPETGALLGNYPTPGAGFFYSRADDAPGRSSTIERAHPRPNRPRGRSLDEDLLDLPPGQLPMHLDQGPAGTGAHCIASKDGLLYIAVPPARTIYVIDKSNWVVQAEWPTANRRPHGFVWADDDKSSIWVADANLHAFHRHDINTGEILDGMQLADNGSVVHGAAMHNGHIYYCDDVGWMFRFRV